MKLSVWLLFTLLLHYPSWVLAIFFSCPRVFLHFRCFRGRGEIKYISGFFFVTKKSSLSSGLSLPVRVYSLSPNRRIGYSFWFALWTISKINNYSIDLISAKRIPFSYFLLKRDSINSSLSKWNKEKNLLSDVSPVDWMLPWVEGINHSPFDLLMPFLNWPYQYEKSGRVCGRPAHLYIFTPLHSSPFSKSSFSSVRLAIDDAYHAPLRIEHMDGEFYLHGYFLFKASRKWKIDGS